MIQYPKNWLLCKPEGNEKVYPILIDKVIKYKLQDKNFV